MTLSIGVATFPKMPTTPSRSLPSLTKRYIRRRERGGIGRFEPIVSENRLSQGGPKLVDN